VSTGLMISLLTRMQWLSFLISRACVLNGESSDKDERTSPRGTDKRAKELDERAGNFFFERAHKMKFYFFLSSSSFLLSLSSLLFFVLRPLSP
jgi:hypothetical protein